MRLSVSELSMRLAHLLLERTVDDVVVLRDSEGAGLLGCSIPVYRYALRQLEAVGYVTFDRLAVEPRFDRAEPARRVVVDRAHWLVGTLAALSGAEGGAL